MSGKLLEDAAETLFPLPSSPACLHFLSFLLLNSWPAVNWSGYSVASLLFITVSYCLYCGNTWRPQLPQGPAVLGSRQTYNKWQLLCHSLDHDCPVTFSVVLQEISVAQPMSHIVENHSFERPDNIYESMYLTCILPNTKGSCYKLPVIQGIFKSHHGAFHRRHSSPRNILHLFYCLKIKWMESLIVFLF